MCYGTAIARPDRQGWRVVQRTVAGVNDWSGGVGHGVMIAWPVADPKPYRGLVQT